jgi:hypothetical protein
MKLWTLEYNEDNKANFPQVMYKGREIKPDMKFKIIQELFRIFYLTHRDAKNKIKEIEKNNQELPYGGLYNLILPPKEVEFQKEYLIDLLNYFSMEIDNLL